MPAVLGVAPRVQPTASDPAFPPILSITARNLPLADPLSRIAVRILSGSGDAGARELTPILPAAPAGDGTAVMTVTLPAAGAGAELVARVVV